MSYFVHKKSVSTRKVCIIFIKKIKNLKKFKKPPKKHFLVGFLGGFFWVGFFGWVFYCQPWKEEKEGAVKKTKKKGKLTERLISQGLLTPRMMEELKREIQDGET
jgi:hypothetical protein